MNREKGKGKKMSTPLVETIEMYEEFDTVFSQCKDNLRYGKLWEEFTVEELIGYARFKAKRGNLLYNKWKKTHDEFFCKKSQDDIQDVIKKP